MQDRDRKSAKGKAPISRHPLFPAVVALWFGALFGLGSMAIRPGLIEDMVLAAGIDTLVPAAAPPLGMTARKRSNCTRRLASPSAASLLSARP